MRKPNYIQIKFVAGRVQSDIWMSYTDIEDCLKEIQRLSASNILSSEHKATSDFFTGISDKLEDIVTRINYLLNF